MYNANKSYYSCDCYFDCIIPAPSSVKAAAAAKLKNKGYFPEENTPLFKLAINLALVCVCIWACKCTQCPQVHSFQSCQTLLGPATSVTRDLCNSCFVLSTPGPSDIPLLETPHHHHRSQMTDSPLLSVPPHYPSSLWPPQHLCLSAWLPLAFQ